MTVTLNPILSALMALYDKHGVNGVTRNLLHHSYYSLYQKLREEYGGLRGARKELVDRGLLHDSPPAIVAGEKATARIMLPPSLASFIRWHADRAGLSPAQWILEKSS